MQEPTEYLRVSYSSLNTFASCNRKFEFDKLYPRPPRDQEDFYAADVGKALHAGFQDYLIHGDREKSVWEFMLAFPYESEFSQPNDYRSFEAALATLEDMFEEVRLQDYELAKIRRPNNTKELEAGLSGGVVVPAIEVPFEIRFKGLVLPDGRGVAFIGYIDAIMLNKLTKMFRTLDIKTTRVSLKDATGKYQFDSQQVPYGVVVDHLAQGVVDQFEVLYLDTYIDLVDPKTQLYPFKKTRNDIQEWVTNKMLQFEQIQRYMANDYFPRTDSGCMFYNKTCRYLAPCMTREKDELMNWFLMGADPAPQEPFFPWVIADIDVGVAA